MVLHITNFYSKIDQFRNAITKELSNLKEFRVLRKYRLPAETSERNCYIACVILSVLVIASNVVFHPMIGSYNNLPTVYFRPYFEYYYTRIPLYVLYSFYIFLMTYSILFSLFETYYRLWGAHLLHFRLMEYIHQHLCKEYNTFDIIETESEQDNIYQNLKRCVRFHILLKR